VTYSEDDMTDALLLFHNRARDNGLMRDLEVGVASQVLCARCRVKRFLTAAARS
jgi:hypothetical protein